MSELKALAFIQATNDLPLDIQMLIWRQIPKPHLSVRMQGFLGRWKARRANA
tara:strand:+ start:634 stop:789 length:156 start_codon:yes stop_codon:yes gene_type:complete